MVKQRAGSFRTGPRNEFFKARDVLALGLNGLIAV